MQTADFKDKNNKTVMEAKIEKISELSKLLNVKTRMSDNLFHLFGKFGIGHLLSRLSLEKQDGVSASELILLFVFFRIVVESIICDNDKEMSKALVMTEVFNPNQLLEHNVLKFLFLCCFLTSFIFLSSSCLSL